MVRRARRRGWDERELVAQFARVLDDAHDRPGPAVDSQVGPDLDPQQLGDAVGDGDLAGAGRVAAAAECEELVAVGPVGVLRAEVDRLDAAGDGQRAVPDHLRRPERSLDRGQTRRELARIGAVEPEQVTCRAELGVVRWNSRCRRS